MTDELKNAAQMCDDFAAPDMAAALRGQPAAQATPEPVEPTDEMVMAGALAHQRSPCHDFIGPIGDAWVAMLAAAQANGADHG